MQQLNAVYLLSVCCGAIEVICSSERLECRRTATSRFARFLPKERGANAVADDTSDGIHDAARNFQD
jgi:hypothetical protein